MIFHLPFKIDKNRFSASQIRPIKMLESFQKLGYEVDVVEGYGVKRKQNIKDIKRKIKNGVKYDFLYSESSTMPTLLTEKNHFPFFPLLDFSFFLYCKKHNIRIGLFYRDVYWMFPLDNFSFKNAIAIIFYRYDIRKYNKLLDVIFLPSIQMGKYIPDLKIQNIVPLPPGIEVHNVQECIKEKDENVKLLFVGAISGLYDLSMLFKIVDTLKNIQLTICCREKDWEFEKERYLPFVHDNITIVHKSGLELPNLYSNADVVCVFFKSDEYLNFAVPYKLYESIAHGCPILANIDTLTGQYVASNRLGFTCAYDEDSLRYMLTHLDKSLLEEFRLNMKQIAMGATWVDRCMQVEMSLKL